jgi:hypothetical protein
MFHCRRKLLTWLARNVENCGVLKIRALHEATKFAGLRNAGMPE